jgi:hypothetical protein
MAKQASEELRACETAGLTVTLPIARPSNLAGRASTLGSTAGGAGETECSAEPIDLDQRKVRLLVALGCCSEAIRKATSGCYARPRRIDRFSRQGLLPLLSESFMRTFHPLVLSVLLVAQSASAQAADLNGAWTDDASACGAVFKKEDNKLAFRRDADFHAGGLIVEGRKVTGTFQKCTIKSLRDDGPNVQVVASCSDGVAVSDVPFDVKITGENSITLSSTKPVPVEMLYFRCSM